MWLLIEHILSQKLKVGTVKVPKYSETEGVIDLSNMRYSKELFVVRTFCRWLDKT